MDKWVAHRGLKTALCWTIGKPIPHYAHRRTDARAVDNDKTVNHGPACPSKFLMDFSSPYKLGF